MGWFLPRNSRLQWYQRGICFVAHLGGNTRSTLIRQQENIPYPSVKILIKVKRFDRYTMTSCLQSYLNRKWIPYRMQRTKPRWARSVAHTHTHTIQLSQFPQRQATSYTKAKLFPTPWKIIRRRVIIISSSNTLIHCHHCQGVPPN